MRNAQRILVRKPDRKWSYGRSRCKWEDIRIEFRESVGRWGLQSSGLGIGTSGRLLWTQ